MGCCGRKSSDENTQAASYPREAVMPDGTKVMVSSAAMERVERERYRQRERTEAKVKGYTVQR